MSIPWQILIASSSLESRRALMQILTRQGLDPIGVANVAECREVMAKQRVGLVFSDPHLADGNYQDLLDIARSSAEKVRVVVTSNHADWDEYLEAIRHGAFDVIASPCRPTDVEWMVIQAKRDERNHPSELLRENESAPLSRAVAS
jgi:DNA-binding NtrC family response regulator